ncbi:hypothetical protein ACQE98_00365 [Ornithinimicrobium sp. W1679]|uniref:hypothetical protein n=1 Tax=Ornithinimicrobium sp. W1679 TaxID=3418770 RepID=UPI003CF8E477
MSRLDLRLHTDLPVPLDVVAAVEERAQSLNIPTLLIGAVARDLVVHGPTAARSPRVTLDVDVAIAVDRAGFEAFTRGWPGVRGSEHSFLVCGVEVDVVPFGPLESDRSVEFDDGHVLDVNGLAEAAGTAVVVVLPGGLEVHSASLPAQAALKVLAWRDRRARTPKDARDLREILEAAAESPHVNDVWADEVALERAEYDIFLAAAFRVGRLAAEPFSVEDGLCVLDVIEDEERARLLALDMGGALASDLVSHLAAGFRWSLLGGASQPSP